MDYTHVHLLLNHFPIVGTITGTTLLLYSYWKKNAGIQQISLATLFVMALLAIPVFLTGEPAEESVENLPGIAKAIIEEHEEAAEIAFWFMMAAGLASLICIVLQINRHKLIPILIIIPLALSLITSGLMIRTGYLGGQIRHTEISGNKSVNPVNEQPIETDDD